MTRKTFIIWKLPGVWLGFSVLCLPPKVYAGKWSCLHFSGEYQPGAETVENAQNEYNMLEFLCEVDLTRCLARFLRVVPSTKWKCRLIAHFLGWILVWSRRVASDFLFRPWTKRECRLMILSALFRRIWTRSCFENNFNHDRYDKIRYDPKLL